MSTGFYVTTFCNRAHQLSDGKPIAHECYVIPPRLLKAEREESPDALKLWQQWSSSHRVSHRGVKRTEEATSGGSPNIPRFGRMTPDQLLDFWGRYHRPSRKDAEELIGDRRPGFTGIAHMIALYASNFATVLRGHKEYAQHAKSCLDKMPPDIAEAVKKASRK